MTRAELRRLLGELPQRWLMFFELLAHTGLRISEALGLDWTDVEFGARPRLRVRRQCYRGRVSRLKTRNSRRDLPISPALARKLWAVRPPHAEGPIFVTRNGTRFGDRNVRRVLVAAAIRAGLTKQVTDPRGRLLTVSRVSFHTFRHTCASLLFEGGKNIKQVSRWLGHADPAFTLRTYVHMLDDGLGEVSFLDAATAPNSNAAPGNAVAA
jgi:integrase